ncbi:FtsB family cell division protein [Chitinophaga nivalis]|uniref:Septum formation initiator family protein n=1 Tax=Chitinophaga nivalis TaxID=2991709 RepID=A0ABT3IX74_9BACT|nr:septum formation initiator family protein [Chitinophaga nivalis]MCW3461975.1 septum formation initiator family protein [Chitinophaga nivalis]MCW3488334.1 septum formation initiator family protein [Chitinophaga nivalis]
MPLPKSIKIPRYLKNKFFIAAAAFFIWIAFLDKTNLMYNYQLTSEENKLEGQKEFFINEIKSTREEQQELLSSPEKLEKFAREKYYMKKDNEDLFIIAPAPKP